MARVRLIAVPLGVLLIGAASLASAAGSPALHAEARLVAGDGRPVGWARFVEDGTGRVHVSAHVTGMSPGLHGIHIHAIGACEPSAFTSAGGHHNPLGVAHGLDSAGGGHAGDLPNLVVNEDGVGRLSATTIRATLSPGLRSMFDADGSAVVIHAGQDDQVTDPTGNSGARVACGVITRD